MLKIAAALWLFLLVMVSCGPSIEDVNAIDPDRLPPIIGETHKDRVESQQQIISHQELEKVEQREEVEHYERQKRYNDLMREKAGVK